MSTKGTQKTLLNQFMAITGVSEKTGSKLLKASNWKVDQAADSFFASNGAGSGGGRDSETLGNLFEKYRVSTDDENMTSVDGTMKYLSDLDVNLENAELFLVLELVQAPAVSDMSKEAFINGWKTTGADTLAKQKAYIASQVKQLSSDNILFKRVYRHTFMCAKERSVKAITLDDAITFWVMLFASPGKQLVTKSYDWKALWIEFLQAKWTKSVNKDMWNQTLEFFLKALQDEDLTFYSEEGAWPGVIDDFVAYVKAKKGLISDNMETD